MAWEQSRSQTSLMLGIGYGEERYTFTFGLDPEDRMLGLVRHSEGLLPEHLGSAIPLRPLEIGQAAILGVDTQGKDFYILATPEITYYGPNPENLV